MKLSRSNMLRRENDLRVCDPGVQSPPMASKKNLATKPEAEEDARDPEIERRPSKARNKRLEVTVTILSFYLFH